MKYFSLFYKFRLLQNTLFLRFEEDMKVNTDLIFAPFWVPSKRLNLLLNTVTASVFCVSSPLTVRITENKLYVNKF